MYQACVSSVHICDYIEQYDRFSNAFLYKTEKRSVKNIANFKSLAFEIWSYNKRRNTKFAIEFAQTMPKTETKLQFNLHWNVI